MAESDKARINLTVTLQYSVDGAAWDTVKSSSYTLEKVDEGTSNEYKDIVLTFNSTELAYGTGVQYRIMIDKYNGLDGVLTPSNYVWITGCTVN